MHIIDFNHCTLPKCNCGWSVFIGGSTEKELKTIKEILKPHLVADTTNYKTKINQEKFLD
jgi:hypothetical protein